MLLELIQEANALPANRYGNNHWDFDSNQNVWWGALAVGICLLVTFAFTGRRRR